MCDCYDTVCAVCKKEIIPVHITDFCIPRDHMKIYCQKHIPQKDVVIHKIVEDEYHYKSELSLMGKKRNPIEYPLGWRMGVRYLKKPPSKHGFHAVTPNVCAQHIGNVIPKQGNPFWITEWTERNYNTEIEAVEAMINLRSDSSPFEQVWRRYIINLKGDGVLKKLDIPNDVLNEIKVISRRLKKRYRGLLAIILIGSFAEGTPEEDSDIDIVFVRRGRTYHTGLLDITEGTKRRIQLIPFNKKLLDYHFKNSTTMSYAIQRGKIIYERGGFLQKYYAWPLGYPNNLWMKDWYNHWIDKYSYGIKDFKRSRKIGFDYITDCLSRAVVNFGILFVETRCHIPTTKKDLERCFNKKIEDKRIREGFKIAIHAHHEDRDVSLTEAERIYYAGKFLKEELKMHFLRVEKHKAHVDELQRVLAQNN